MIDLGTESLYNAVQLPLVSLRSINQGRKEAEMHGASSKERKKIANLKHSCTVLGIVLLAEAIEAEVTQGVIMMTVGGRWQFEDGGSEGTI